MGSLNKLPPEVAKELLRHVAPRKSTQRAAQQLAAQQQQQQSQKRGSGWVLAGCLAFTGTAFAIPFVAQKWIGNLNARDEPLTHAQIRRGAFNNSGSTDAGKDPAWDFRKGQYKKDDNYWAIFDDKSSSTAFGSMVSATGKDDSKEPVAAPKKP